MTYEEALRIAKQTYNSGVIVEAEDYAFWKIVIEALEKKITKRVNGKGKQEFSAIDWEGDRNTKYLCPTCYKFVRKYDKYCPRCGQKLQFPVAKWSEYIEGVSRMMHLEWE